MSVLGVFETSVTSVLVAEAEEEAELAGIVASVVVVAGVEMAASETDQRSV